MSMFENETKQTIEAAYDKMTEVERSIADFFVSNTEKRNFSSRSISKMLYVSEATLSRFAQKCGYKGYRELIFSYERDLESEKKYVGSEQGISMVTKKVRNTYQALLEKEFEILDESQIRRVAGMMNTSDKVLVCGMGSSGYAAEDLSFRFMRIGLDISAVTDSQIMKISATFADEKTMVIAVSLSGETAEVVECARIAREKGAQVICITAAPESALAKECMEVLRVATCKNLDTGLKISPQFSILAVADVIFSYYFENDSYFKTQQYRATLQAIRGKWEKAQEK